MSMLNCGGGGGEGVCVNMPKKKTSQSHLT